MVENHNSKVCGGGEKKGLTKKNLFIGFYLYWKELKSNMFTGLSQGWHWV